jgi:hypothetical protein
MRLPYKISYHLLLQARIEQLREGRAVIGFGLGDLNICAQPLDRCDGWPLGVLGGVLGTLRAELEVGAGLLCRGWALGRWFNIGTRIQLRHAHQLHPRHSDPSSPPAPRHPGTPTLD